MTGRPLTRLQCDMRRTSRFFGTKVLHIIHNRRWLLCSSFNGSTAEMDTYVYNAARTAASCAFIAHPELRGVR